MKKINKVFFVLDIISACLLLVLLVLIVLIAVFSASIGKETAGNLCSILSGGVFLLCSLSFIFLMCWNQDFRPTKKERLEKEQLHEKNNNQ